MPANHGAANQENKMNASDFRIEDIRNVTLNGSKAIIFKAFSKQDDVFVFCGEFSAPVRTAKRDLWMIAAAAE